MSADVVARVESACAQLVERGEAVTFAAVAAHAGIAKATLYRRLELRAVVEEHRRDDREAHSLSSIVVELELLRQGLEVVAAKVRQHEEELRALRRRTAKEK
jgi:AcrR family transcriptional regulator